MNRLKEERSSPPAAVVVGLMVLTACLAAFGAPPAWALGTPAGTIIQCTAQVTYTLAGLPASYSAAATESFTVAEIIDCTVTWQDAGDVPAGSPQSGCALTFLLTNTGNGPEPFRLTADTALGGDDFDPLNPVIWLESNGVPGLQTAGAGPDTQYVSGSNDPLLGPDAQALFYVSADIPAGLADNALGLLRFSSAAMTPGAAGSPPGTQLPGAGLAGQDAVVGYTRADGAAVGRYAVTALLVTLNKQIRRISDPFGGEQPYPGARVRYRIVASLSGTGTAEGLSISDPVPAGMTYVAQSMRLNGAGQTDAADAPVDNADFNITTPNTITIQLGDVVAPATFTIDFETTININ